MGLEVANLTARLGAHLDDSGFDRFDRRYEKSEAKARNPITAKATVKTDTDGLDRYDRKLKDVDKSHADLTTGTTKTGRVLTGLGRTAAAVGAAGGFGALAIGAKNAFSAFKESEQVGRQTEAVLKSTGGAARVTAKDVGDLATAISKKTGIDDEAIQSGENLLLTFTNVRNETGKGNDIFNQATKIMTDMSVALGTDAKGSAIQLGKALNDPVKGITALTRVGVSFTQQQKDQIKTLTASGDKLGAQKIILKELNKEFGGSAEATATNSKKLKVSMGNLAESIGGLLSPAFEKVSGWLTKFIDGMTEGTGTGGAFLKFVRSAGSAVGGVFSTAFRTAGKIINGFKSIIEDNRDRLEQIGSTASSLARNVFNAFTKIAGAFKSTFGGGSSSGKDVRTIISALLDFYGAVSKVYENVAKRALPGIVTAFRGFFTVVRGIIRVISGVLTGDFGKAWDGVKDIFGGAIKVLTGTLRAATAPFRAAISAIGKAIGSGFSAAWGGALDLARGFINKIIDVINVIPGVNIKHIGGGGAKGDAGLSYTAPKGDAGGARRIGQYAEGGKVTAPIAIMGEEAPQHPEWVIPTNPAYRKRAVALWMQSAKDLGIPGFALGGLLDAGKSAAGFVADKAGDAANIASYAIPGVGAVRSAYGLASKLIDRLPGNPGGMLKGTFDYALNKAKDFIGDKAKGVFNKAKDAAASVFSGGGGGGSTTGLVPQVLRAIQWAHGHGWGGSVISGFRSPSSQIAAAQQYAARRGMPLSALYPNGVLASNHTTGQAIDVTDPGGFRASMANAPADSRLLGLVSGDPSHFSVSGHRKGGILGMIGGLFGGERLSGGTLAFKKGGKLSKARAAVKSTGSTVRKHENGLPTFDNAIADLERTYGQTDRRFGLTDEQLLIENPDGSTTLDTKAQETRLGEIGGLQSLRKKIKRKNEAYQRQVNKLVKEYGKAVTALNRAIKAASGKKRKKERGNYRDEKAGYIDRINELKRVSKDLGFDIEDSAIDYAELTNEYNTVKGTTGVAAEPDTTDTTDPGPTTDSSPVTVDTTTPTVDPATAPPTLEQIATGVAEALSSFNSSRADLFSQFGANFMRPGGSPGMAAAGARYFGGGSSGTEGGTEQAAGGVTQYITFTGPQPADPHIFTQAAKYEAAAAL